MQIKIAFKAIFLVEGGFLAGGTAKRTPKRHERFGDPAGQDSQEEGERDERIGTRLFARPLAKTQQVAGMQGCPE